jgi:GMP synthase (glutamine-hydrolysing)
MSDSPRFLLLQIRNPDDEMRGQEVRCFARVLQVDPAAIAPFDLLSGAPAAEAIDACELVLLGGSGHYSAAGEGAWLERCLDVLRDLHRRRKPTFASCWGFQAMARALGGRVENHPERAELGTLPLTLSREGREDPVFGPLPDTFHGHMGHEDSVVELPPGAVLLASSERVENQAYRMEDAPIYCTQFHPELNCQDLLERVRAYPQYIERITGLPLEEFSKMIRETKEAESLVRRFVQWALGD